MYYSPKSETTDIWCSNLAKQVLASKVKPDI